LHIGFSRNEKEKSHGSLQTLLGAQLRDGRYTIDNGTSTALSYNVAYAAHSSLVTSLKFAKLPSET
jgi:hypothetical protein